MSAIHEELDPRAVGAPIGASASPLATAADFAALSPDIITRARDVQANVEAADRRGALKRNYTTAAVAVLLLAVVGAAVWYFVFNNDEPTPVARQGAAGRGVASTPPTATPLPVPIDVQITSEPVGAQVFEGEVNLGVTPLTLTLSTTAQRTIRLAMEGHRSALQLVDPAALPVANPAGLLNFLIMLEPGEDPPAAPAAPASVAGSNPGTAPTSAVGDGAEADALAAVPGSKPDAGTEPERPSRTPATKGKSTRNRPKTPSSAAATPRSGGVARPAGGKAKPPRPQTDPSKIKDPFAED